MKERRRTDIDLTLFDPLGRERVFTVKCQFQVSLFDNFEQFSSVIMEFFGSVNVLIEHRTTDCQQADPIVSEGLEEHGGEVRQTDL